MPRPLRNILAGDIDHVLNRGNARRRIFRKPEDYSAFINVIAMASSAIASTCRRCTRAAGRASRWNRYPRASAAAARRPRADRMGSDPFMTRLQIPNWGNKGDGNLNINVRVTF
jgi:hypothetical protein